MKLPLTPVLRHLWKQRLFTALNIAGLSIGIAACWIIYGIVRYEFSFENGVPGKETTFRLITGFVFDEKESYNGGAQAPLYQAIRNQVPAASRVVPVYGRWINRVKVPATGNRQPYEADSPQGIAAVDSVYFDLIPYTWLSGSKSTALKDPGSVVLTLSRATKYFGSLSPHEILGRTIAYNDTLIKTVSGIVNDLDFETEFNTQEFFVLVPKVYPLNAWTNTNGSDKIYIQTASMADTAKVRAQIAAIAEQKMNEFQQENKPTWKMKRWHELLRLEESHFSTFIQEYGIHKASRPVLYGLIGLGGFLLLLACINYINLTTAQIPQRRKEIGVRKTLGSSKADLIARVFIETMMVVLLSVIMAFMLSNLGFALLNDIIPERSQVYAEGLSVLLAAGMLVALVTCIAGWYPAWMIAKVQPIAIIRGNKPDNGRISSFSPRKALIISQFVIAQVFIVCALIMGTQLSYTLRKDLGFNKDAVVLFDVPWSILSVKGNAEKHFALANELRRLPGITQLSLGREPMSDNYSSSQYDYWPEGSKDPIKRQVFRKEVDTNYVRFYELKLLAGRNLTHSDTTNEFVINETAMRAFGFNSPHDALGKIIGQPGNLFPVVGVVKDFHLTNFHNTIDPVALMSNKSNLSEFNVKLNTDDPAQWQHTIKQIESKWNDFFPAGTFNYKFYDETVEAMYKEERNTAKLINLATIISVVISCLGLFGLATLTAFQRTKEIGIRKVLGASVANIIKMLSADFVWLIIIALIIASPLAWWAMHRWLEGFAYRVEIEWWMFAIAGAAAVMVALITTSYQAIRAALENPVNSLRNE